MSEANNILSSTDIERVLSVISRKQTDEMQIVLTHNQYNEVCAEIHTCQNIILGLWEQFAYSIENKTGDITKLHDGGLSALESAYTYLRENGIINEYGLKI